MNLENEKEEILTARRQPISKEKASIIHPLGRPHLLLLPASQAPLPSRPPPQSFKCLFDSLNTVSSAHPEGSPGSA
jgi:hypothetical protein